MLANTVGIMAPPKKPCMARNTIIDSMFQAKAQARLARENPPAAIVNSHRVDSSRDSHPDSGIITTSAISAAVTTQLTSSRPAARPAWISRNELPTIWTFSTATNMPTTIAKKATICRRLGESPRAAGAASAAATPSGSGR